MNLSWTHVHLLLNHFPIVGGIVALVIFLIGMARQSCPLKQASYWIFFLMALLAIPVYYSGTQAYATVESLPPVAMKLPPPSRGLNRLTTVHRATPIINPKFYDSLGKSIDNTPPDCIFVIAFL